MTREELKELIRTEPTIAATFAEVDAEFAKAAAHTETLGRRRAELKGKLDAIAQAKAELAKPTEKPAASTPATSINPKR